MLELATWRTHFAPEIVGESPQIVDALDVVRRVADTDCSILITGETGTGKELFARAAHRASPRRNRPMISVNCAALPEGLLETELFGHIKGAFTGATNARAGRFVSAHEGTIFLDEVGDLPLAAQAKLLRVLEARVVSPVGSDTELPVDVRIIAATHRNLAEMVEQGTFRADLYFRLAVVPIHLPALRERPDDILAIADVYVARARERLGRNVDGFDLGARAALSDYPWPGNVRELSHLVERSVLLARKPILSKADLAMPVVKAKPARSADESGPVRAPVPVADDTSLDLRSALEALERELISRALQRAEGNRTEAAALLGLNRTTLVEKLRKLAA
ncbi:MAG TPA: sigma 54-interacting transcriptional regulator [Kofleriaceae bacterium]|jgi:transcriptional regulator with GAF, ATPase, and Fis domain|nr:sigma 54-interacting transcriptional regulator [Kofleriaceae bacterium]